MPFTGTPSTPISRWSSSELRGEEGGLARLRESAGRHLKGIALKNSIESFKARLEASSAKATLSRRRRLLERERPLRWREQTLGLALYGSPDEAKEPARLIREVKRLRDDVEETLLNQS
jgi:hypothetical protein